MAMHVYALILLLCFTVPIRCQNASTNTTDATDDLDPSLTAAELINLGEKSNNKLLWLLGNAFNDIEQSLKRTIRRGVIQRFNGKTFNNDTETMRDHFCRLHECDDWSDWGQCSVEPGKTFGYATRIRTCGYNDSYCSYPAGSARNETQTRVCERDGSCPMNYTAVEGMGQTFCLQYVRMSLNMVDATLICQKRGGELININTEAKIEALHTLFPDDSTTIWVNGYRTSRYPVTWSYTYGDPPVVENWASGEPSNSRSQECRVEESWPRYLYDRSCYDHHLFVCEYTQSV